MSDYAYALGEEAVRAFTALSLNQRKHLLREFDRLARLPYQIGDYRESGASGRIYEAKLADETLVTWWSDHAAKEVRIVRIELVE
ncbi:MAG: hypothetical protein HYV75_09585 [Opitutae bacterium]|nr:hypothetical protein [Opitutae bacterium]